MDLLTVALLVCTPVGVALVAHVVWTTVRDGRRLDAVVARIEAAEAMPVPVPVRSLQAVGGGWSVLVDEEES